jgi:hypothetical protein
MVEKVTKIAFIIESLFKVMNEDIFLQFAKSLVIIRKLFDNVPKLQIINIKQLRNAARTKTHSISLSRKKI